MPANMNKASVVVIMGLVLIHAFWNLAGLVGMTQTTFDTPILVVMLLIDVLVLYGLYYTQTWSWWLLLYFGIYQACKGLTTIIQGGDTQSFIYFLLVLVLLGALTKKETIEEYKPNLTYIRGW